jgi:hypothetical protein
LRFCGKACKKIAMSLFLIEFDASTHRSRGHAGVLNPRFTNLTARGLKNYTGFVAGAFAPVFLLGNTH